MKFIKKTARKTVLNLLKAIYSRPSKFVVEGVSVSVCVCPGTEESKVGNHNPGITCSCFAFFTSVLTNGGLSVCSCWPAAWNALPKSWSRGQQLWISAQITSCVIFRRGLPSGDIGELVATCFRSN